MTPLRYYIDIPDKKTPYQEYRDGMQATINDIFESSSTIYTLQQELNPGTQTYTDLQVRLVQAINSETGLKLGDDFRKIIFKDGSSNPVMGKRYSFEDNIWITVNTDNYTHPTFNSTLARCHTTMNWYLNDGTIHKEPIVLRSNLTDTSFIFKQKLDKSEGELTGMVQYNDFTSQLGINDEMIFGFGNSKQKYKIRAVNTSISQKTFEDDPKIIKVDFMIYEANKSEDNLSERVSGLIPDYTINIQSENFEQLVGYTAQLTANVYENDEIVQRNVVWSSNDETIATVDQNGNIELLQLGSVDITARLGENTAVEDSITIDVVSSIINDNFEIRITPDEEIVKQGQSVEYDVYLYNNDVQQVDAFTFNVLNNNVPNDNYELEVLSSNKFKVKNIEAFSGATLDIECVSGANNRTLNIELKGLW